MITEEQKRIWDEYAINKYNNNVRQIAIKEGLEKGLAKGLEKGLTRCLARGRTEGIAEGLSKGKLEMAKAMLASDIPISQVVSISGFSKAEIRSL